MYLNVAFLSQPLYSINSPSKVFLIYCCAFKIFLDILINFIVALSLCLNYTRYLLSFKIISKRRIKFTKRFDNNTRKFIKNNDPLNEWLLSNIDKTGNQKDLVKSSDLYNDYYNFVEGNTKGVNQLKIKKFFEEEHNINQIRKNTGMFYSALKFVQN